MTDITRVGQDVSQEITLKEHLYLFEVIPNASTLNTVDIATTSKEDSLAIV